MDESEEERIELKEEEELTFRIFRFSDQLDLSHSNPISSSFATCQSASLEYLVL